MALVFTNTNKIDEIYVKILIYGISGAGKTFSLATVPNLVIISSEKGLLTLAGYNINVMAISSFEDLVQAYNILSDPAKRGSIKAVAIDSLTEIGEVILAKAKKEFKDQRQAYVDLADKTTDVIKKFRDLDGLHVIMVAKIANYKEDLTGYVKYFPAMPGTKLANNLPYLFDEVFYLGLQHNRETNETVRYFQTAADDQVTAKDRSGALNRYEPVHLGNIIEKIIQHKRNISIQHGGQNG